MRFAAWHPPTSHVILLLDAKLLNSLFFPQFEQFVLHSFHFVKLLIFLLVLFVSLGKSINENSQEQIEQDPIANKDP